MAGIEHPIKVAALRSGLSPHVIRIWEKRYGAIRPDRTGTNRRLYSESDIERLSLLANATAAGHSIGSIAHLADEQLAGLVATKLQPTFVTSKLQDVPFLPEAVVAIKTLDGDALEGILEKGIVELGHQGLLQKLISPLANEVGELWRQGSLTAAHEHFASALIRSFLSNSTRPFSGSGSGPVLIVATPSGQLHEIGAAMVSTAAATVGWKPIYLGAGLPPAEIAGAANQQQATAVALSIVYPEGDGMLAHELRLLRKYLRQQTAILTGGRAAASYKETLGEIGAINSETLDDLYRHLDALRRDKATTHP